MSKPTGAFDRVFESRDENLFAELVRDLLGQPCIGWRKSYGRTGSLHYGALVGRPNPPPKAVHKDHGAWVIGLWDSDRRITWPTGEVLDNREAGDDVVVGRLRELEGARVQGIRVHPESLTLTIDHSNGIKLELITDAASNSQDEQWAIELPTGQAIAVFGNSRWALQENR